MAELDCPGLPSQGLKIKQNKNKKKPKNTKQNKKTPCNLKLGLVDLKLASQDLALLWS